MTKLPGDLFLDSLSNTYNSGYLIHRVGPGLRYHTEKTMFVTNINYQRSTLTGDQVFPTSAKDQMDASFNNVVYMADASDAVQSEQYVADPDEFENKQSVGHPVAERSGCFQSVVHIAG